MRVDWNEALRRAYDQGYWDARREFERHLATMHQGSREGGRMQGGGEMNRSQWEGGRDRAHGQSSYGRSVYGPEDQGREGRWHGGMHGRGDSEELGREGRQSYGDRRDMGYRGPESNRDYPPGDRRGAFENGGDWRGGRFRHDRDEPRDENVGFFEKVGQEVRSWFNDDDRDRDRHRDDRRWRDYDR